MKELKISIDDDLYDVLELHRRAAYQLTDVERSMENFVVLMSAVGVISYGRALTPTTQEEMSEVILAIIGEAPEKANFMRRIYELTKKQREKEIGLKK